MSAVRELVQFRVVHICQTSAISSSAIEKSTVIEKRTVTWLDNSYAYSNKKMPRPYSGLDDPSLTVI